MKPDTKRRFLQEGALLFDLDGTLLDTAPDFRTVLHDMCSAQDIKPPSDCEIHATVSSGARALTALAFGAYVADKPDPPEKLALLNEELLTRYARVILSSRASLYPGMEELLETLQVCGTPWGIVTNKPERFSVPLLATLDLGSRCGVLICPDHVSQRKPHPEALLLACQRLGKDPRHSIYVGDHPRDIESGNAAGMLTIAAAYGYLPVHPPLAQWGADLIIEGVNELYQYIWS